MYIYFVKRVSEVILNIGALALLLRWKRVAQECDLVKGMTGVVISHKIEVLMLREHDIKHRKFMIQE